MRSYVCLSGCALSTAGASVGFGSNKDWWSDQRWVAHYCRVSPATMIRQLRETPNGWFEHWTSLSERDRRQITKLSAIEVGSLSVLN